MIVDVRLQVKVCDARGVVLLKLFGGDGDWLHETAMVFGNYMQPAVLAERFAASMRVGCVTIDIGDCTKTDLTAIHP